MTKKQRLLITLFISTILLIALPTTVLYAADGEQEYIPDFSVATESEIAQVQDAMQKLGFGEAESISVLYNHEDTAKFLLGISDCGYMIVDRDTWALLEKSEGPSAYLDYLEEVKYFGGVELYFIKTDTGFIDLNTGETTEHMSYIAAYDDLGVVSQNEEIEGAISILSLDTFAQGDEVLLPYTEEFIQKCAFGNNGGSEGNTCTAVAAGYTSLP